MAVVSIPPRKITRLAKLQLRARRTESNSTANACEEDREHGNNADQGSHHMETRLRQVTKVIHGEDACDLTELSSSMHAGIIEKVKGEPIQG